MRANEFQNVSVIAKQYSTASGGNSFTSNMDHSRHMTALMDREEFYGLALSRCLRLTPSTASRC